MKKIFYLLVSAIVALALSACHTDNPDEPKNMVDNGVWPVPADAGDESYKPGDDFFMFCNGGFWKSAQVDESKVDVNCWAKVEVPRLMDQRLSALNIPSLEKIKSDIARRDEATIALQQQHLQEAMARVEALQTPEEAWRLAARMMKEGYHMTVNLLPFSHNGRLALCIGIDNANDYAASMFKPGDDPAWRLANDPGVLAQVRPLMDAATKSIDAEQWPMLVTMMQELGVASENAYFMGEYPNVVQQGKAEAVIDVFNTIQNFGVDEFCEKILLPAIREEAVLFSDETSLTQEELLNIISKKYLRYERSKVFADAYVNAEMKQRAIAHCEQMRETFRQRIDASTWMSDASKQSVRRKLDAMTFNVGCPDQWMPEGLPDLSACETILDDVLALRRTLLQFNIGLAGQLTVKAGFLSNIANSFELTEANAFYALNHNSMNILPAWLMEPYYQEGANEAFNYATYYCTGHEMTHGFDTTGSQYDWQGDLGSLFASEADQQEFLRRAQQLIDRYNQFEVLPWSLPGLYADGAFTVGENIADLGGFLLAYETYLRHLREAGFTGDQYDLQRRRFYLAYAWQMHGKYSVKYAHDRTLGADNAPGAKDTHSLLRERVNGVVMNTEDWYELFPIQPEDKLYCKDADRVRIW
ncbi:MAG: hypothetical protein IKI85_07585 [Bacteroidales bacterium]|nr:hypothetical protein [Bacteroidales bacterium]